jgi:hypothetical protein
VLTDDRLVETHCQDSAPALRLIQCIQPNQRGRPPAVRTACRYRQATDRVPAGSLVRHPLCPRCGERLGYRETSAGAVFLHIDDPAFRLTVLGATR